MSIIKEALARSREREIGREGESERERERERERGGGRILDTGKPGICLDPTLNRFPGSLIYPHFLAYDQHGRISKKHYEFQKFQEPRAGVEPGSF